MMKCPVRSLGPVVSVDEIKEAMGLPIIHGFPIIDEDNYVMGLVSREALMVLVGNKCWVERDDNVKTDEVTQRAKS